MITALVACGAVLLALVSLYAVAILRAWRLGPLSRLLAPSYGACFRCKTSWRFAKPHVTAYEPGRAVHPLCERCWKELATPEARYVFYGRFLTAWHDVYAASGDQEQMERIRRAATSIVAALQAGG